MVAKIVPTNKKEFILQDGILLDDRVPGFENLTHEDAESLKWVSVVGAAIGYELLLEGRQEVTATISKKRLKTDPQGYENQIQLQKGHVYVLGGGTKVIPNE